MRLWLKIRQSMKDQRYRIFILDGDAEIHIGIIGNPRGYAEEYQALALAENVRDGMDKKFLGKDVEIYGTNGNRLA